MVATSTPLLRPLGFGELLDAAIRLYRRNFLKFIGIIALVQIPMTLLNLIFSLSAFSGWLQRIQQISQTPFADPADFFGPEFWTGMAFSLLLALVYVILVQGFAAAALTRAVADTYLGQPTGILDSYRKAGRSGVRLMLAILLASLISIGFFIWMIVPCVGWLTGPGLLFFFGVVFMSFIAPVVVLEKSGVTVSLRRAWELVRRRFWWVIAFALVLYLFNLLVVSGPSSLVGVAVRLVVGNSLAAAPSLVIWQSVAQSLVGLFFSLIYVPLQLTAFTLLYFDLRVRTEGFDLALLAEAQQPPAVETATASAPPITTRLLSWAEVGYFSLLTVGASVFCGAFYFVFALLGFAILASQGVP